jgi:Tfp pilus assembly protein FimT
MERQALLVRKSSRHFRRRPFLPAAQAGHTLIEVATVLSLLGLCFVVGGAFLARGLGAVEARSAAQDWQAAAAWAQATAIWQGSGTDIEFESGNVSVNAGAGSSGGDLGAAAPAVDVAVNVVRWESGRGVVVRFTGGTGAPNAAGSLYFKAPGYAQRVTVRLESGLTTRVRVEAAP